MYLYILCVLLCSIETIIVSLCANKDIIIIIIMLGQKLKLHFMTSGHYSVPLGSATSEEEKVEETFLKIEELDRESKRKACRKLYIQFGHARSNRLLNLLKDANVEDKETSDFIKEVKEKCETCIKFKKSKLRPVV